MAPDQRPLYFMSPKRNQRVIVRMRLPHVIMIFRPPIIVMVPPPLRRFGGIQSLDVSRGQRHAQVPQLHGLVLAVAEDVTPVALAVDVGEPLHVADEGSRLLPRRHAARVPHFDGAVVGAGIQNVRRLLVGEADGVDVVGVASDVVERHAALDVVDDDEAGAVGVGAGAGYEGAPVAGEADGEGREGIHATGEIERVWVTGVVGVGRGEANLAC